jgi:hypothetical protein
MYKNLRICKSNFLYTYVEEIDVIFPRLLAVIQIGEHKKKNGYYTKKMKKTKKLKMKKMKKMKKWRMKKRF